MPRVSMLPSDDSTSTKISPVPGVSMASSENSTATKIGQVLTSHYNLNPDGEGLVYSRPDSRGGIFLAVKEGDQEKRLVVLDRDNYQPEADEREPQVVLAELLARDDLPADFRLGIQALLRPSPQTVDTSVPAIRGICDLDSIFLNPEPVKHIREPELPERSVTYLAGDSESGKSTVACAWGRDLARAGHGVLLLDLDRNPRAVIRDRFERLGVNFMDCFFSVWDAQQREEAPQPDSHIVLDWCRDMVDMTGKSPLVILDSVVSFLLPDEDENASASMRAFFNRCRAVNRAGGTVLVLHHFNRNGTPRGSSDFKPAADQGFFVSNHNPGSRLLSRIRLRVDKSRYGLVDEITYDYASGHMVRCGVGPSANGKGGKGAEHTAKLIELLAQHAGIGTSAFIKLAKDADIPDHPTRKFLDNGVESGSIHREGSQNRGYRHSLSKEG